jgi:hypothetical protein
MRTDGQTDRQTDRQTGRMTGMIKIIFLAVLAIHLKMDYEIMGCIYYSTYTRVDRFSEFPVALPTSVLCYCLGNTERSGRFAEKL